SENKPENLNSSSTDGMILHLVNLTGFSGNTYFEPLSVHNVSISLKSDFKPSRVFSITTEESIDFRWEDGRIKFSLDELKEYDGIVIQK
ncbi:MAG TPA: hypothetical protein VK589_00030, partial [Chryseolinea sp.]|nr:hypothetical protein [Chryseolinea sp.]